MLPRVEERKKTRRASFILSSLPGAQASISEANVIFFQQVGLRLVGLGSDDEMIVNDWVLVQD
jgi:hypothetical protein